MGQKELIAESFGPDAADAWASFSPTPDQVQALAERGRELLDHFPKMPGACALMSAVYAWSLEKLNLPPAYVVAGSLYLGETRVFGEDGDINGRTRFSRSDPSWDGHAWIIWGDRLVDVSIFRTAYSSGSPPALAAQVAREFGPGRGLLICKTDDVIKSGLRYVPQYVLTQAQVDALARGASAKITGTAPG